MRSLQGKEVRTLDGLSEATRAALGQAFAQTGGTQCGYCTPGIALQAAALFERSPDPSEDEGEEGPEHAPLPVHGLGPGGGGHPGGRGPAPRGGRRAEG
ncbi:MAG: hypothetical protein IPI35_34800 [Deltaproteobacteria bacterium]|nr:hypothetical protein [Deltaproteobacteria bacterium]